MPTRQTTGHERFPLLSGGEPLSLDEVKSHVIDSDDFVEAVSAVPTVLRSTGRIPLSNAQLLTLHSDPPVLIEAPGAGKFINVIAAVAYYAPVSAAFTFPANNPACKWPGEGVQNASTGFECFMAVEPAVSVGMSAMSSGISGASSPKPVSEMENLPLILQSDGGEDPTDGDGEGSIVVYYTIVEF